jgi:DNA-directed RNA polymerase specialized sigma24 family protein
MSGGAFLTTQWSELHRAAGQSLEGRAALARFVEAYWYPLYAFLRRAGHSNDEASDLVQGFFAEFLARDDLGRLKAEGGRFRSYLLGALKHFVSHERERAQAQKRGAGQQPLSLDATFDSEHAEARYALEPAHNESPERLYERRFAQALLQRALERLRQAEEDRGQGEQYLHLRAFLTGEGSSAGYGAAAESLGTSVGALKVAAHRLRKRFRACLIDEVACLVERPQDVEEELRLLWEALSA